jgi:hypothetical protein
MKSVFAASMLSCVFALTACAHAAPSDPADARPEAGDTARPGRPLSMQPGDEVTLPDRSRLRFVAVTADSRCKPGVQCIWTGSDGTQTTVSLNTPAEPRKSAGAWTFELQALDFAEPPHATVQFQAK